MFASSAFFTTCEIIDIPLILSKGLPGNLVADSLDGIIINVLESNPEFSKNFSSTELKRSQLDKSQGQEFLFFEIELKLNKTKKKKTKKSKKT